MEAPKEIWIKSHNPLETLVYSEHELSWMNKDLIKNNGGRFIPDSKYQLAIEALKQVKKLVDDYLVSDEHYKLIFVDKLLKELGEIE